MQYHKNIFLVYLISFLNAFVVSWNVVYVLFLRQNDLNMTQVGFLFSIGAITFLLFEVFTGMYADIYGRKASLLVSSTFFLLGSLLFALSSSFPWFALAAFFIALGGSFWSGCTDSILFESLKSKKEYSRVLSRSHLIFISLGVLTNFFIPIIFKEGINIPFFIGAFFALLSIVPVLFLKETLPAREPSTVWQKYTRQLKNSKRLLALSTSLQWLMGFSVAITFGIALFGDVLNQPLIRDWYSLEAYGLIFALATVVQSVLLYRLDLFISFTKKWSAYWFLVFALPISLLLLLIPSLPWLIVIMGFVWLLGSFRYVLISEEINNLVVDNKERATMHSINSMAQTLLIVIAAPLFGFLLDTVGLVNGLLWLAGLSFLFSAAVTFFKPKNI